MKKTNRIFALLSLLTVLLLAGTSFAWYQPMMVNFGKAHVAGVVRASYFESGDGKTAAQYIDGTYPSEENCAYEIKYPEQFYNLAWLQYLGYFNNSDNASGSTLNTTYFYLSDDLDMTGYVLPPIGTIANPFIGNFNGNGHTISNLTIANTVENDTGLEMSTDEADVSGVEVIGLFGVVGCFEEADNQITVNEGGVSSTYTYDSQVNEIKNLRIDNLTVNSQTNQCLIGMVAGYSNGDVNNVGVANSTIEIADGTSALDAENLLDGFSESVLIGYCTEKYKTAEVSKPYLGEISSSGIDPDDEGDDFGGTIDMLSMYRRISYMIGANQSKLFSQTSNTFDISPFHVRNNYNYRNAYNLNLYQKPTVKYFSYLGNSQISNGAYYTMNAGSFLPINIDKTLAFDGEYTVDGTNNLVTTPYYRDHGVEPVTNNNIGYLVGGNKSNSTTGPRFYFKNATTFLSNSARTGGAMYGYNYASNQWEQITNTSAYSNYDTVHNTLYGVNGEGGTLISGGNVIGLSFYGNAGEFAPLSNNSYTVMLLGQEKTMPLYENCIDFFLTKSGIITGAIAGTYQASTADNMGVDLYMVDRSGAQPAKYRINRVLVDGNGKIAYLLESGSTISEEEYNSTTASIKFDRASMSTLPGMEISYFEIPVSKDLADEYLITRHAVSNAASSDRNGMFVYLDIGANRGEDILPGVEGTNYGMVQYDYKRNIKANVDYVSSANQPLDAQTPSAEILLTETGIYHFRRSDDVGISITDSLSGTPTYIKDSVTVLINGENFTSDGVDINSDEAWNNWTKDPDSRVEWVYNINADVKTLYKDGEIVDKALYPNIVAAFETYLADPTNQ